MDEKFERTGRKSARRCVEQLMTEPARDVTGWWMLELAGLLASGGAERSRTGAVGKERVLHQWGPRANAKVQVLQGQGDGLTDGRGEEMSTHAQPEPGSKERMQCDAMRDTPSANSRGC
jgi:hypothetical protein